MLFQQDDGFSVGWRHTTPFAPQIGIRPDQIGFRPDQIGFMPDQIGFMPDQIGTRPAILVQD